MTAKKDKRYTASRRPKGTDKNTRLTRPIYGCVTETERQRIDHAASLLRQCRSGFLADAALDRATEVIRRAGSTPPGSGYQRSAVASRRQRAEEPRNRNVYGYFSEAEKAKVLFAADLSRQSVSSFLSEAAIYKANDVIRMHDRIKE